jgi:hypothetical protein
VKWSPVNGAPWSGVKAPLMVLNVPKASVSRALLIR